jgi:hypothetical protein
LIFSRKRTVVVDCFTSNTMAYHVSPIARAADHVPRWWRELKATNPNQLSPVSNMKYCRGMVDQFKRGFVLPLWSDLHVDVAAHGDPQFLYQFADRISEAEPHGAEQWGDFADPNKIQHLKLISPWSIRCNKKVDFLAIEPTWNMFSSLPGVRVPPGVVNFFWQTTSNINLLLTKNPSPTLYRLPVGTPLLHYVPLTERVVQLKLHLVTDSELKKVKSAPVSFLRSYSNVKKGCPMGFAQKNKVVK